MDKLDRMLGKRHHLHKIRRHALTANVEPIEQPAVEDLALPKAI
jgi:hypothetical protein